ncbi:MAG: hypothetical protein K8S97_00515 [Anaerolineae bacterium]|nr:hypothetical protein [Anaerolineae bacterium]
MSAKREMHRAALHPLLEAALASPGLLSPDRFTLARYSLNPTLRAHLLDPDIAALEDYLIDHSALPGRRANLELVAAFADEVTALCDGSSMSLNRSYVMLHWLLWQLMNRHPPAVYGADPDSPLQMPEFCGVVGFGAWAVVFQHIEAGVMTLLEHARSPLWRIREGVAFGLQRMLAGNWRSTIRRLQRCAVDVSALEWRGIVAGLAEPSLLVERAHALDALDLHYRALIYLRTRAENVRREDDVRVLRKALGYTVSVAVAAAPEPGFAQLRAWALWDDSDVAWVIRENVKQKRLSAWPDEVAAVGALVT